jgi:hypothetical protein
VRCPHLFFLGGGAAGAQWMNLQRSAPARIHAGEGRRAQGPRRRLVAACNYNYSFRSINLGRKVLIRRAGKA